MNGLFCVQSYAFTRDFSVAEGGKDNAFLSEPRAVATVFLLSLRLMLHFHNIHQNSHLISHVLSVTLVNVKSEPFSQFATLLAELFQSLWIEKSGAVINREDFRRIEFETINYTIVSENNLSDVGVVCFRHDPSHLPKSV